MEAPAEFRVARLAVEVDPGRSLRQGAVRIRLPAIVAAALGALNIHMYRTRRPISLGKEVYSPGRLLVVQGRELAIESSSSVETD